MVGSARTFAARPLLAVLFWSTIRFLVVGGRGRVGAGSARVGSQSNTARRTARAARSRPILYQIWKWPVRPRQVCVRRSCTCTVCECQRCPRLHLSTSRLCNGIGKYDNGFIESIK
ncbi:uncharacterized protein LOC125227586 [Leguminivora glycinivorella]|uniref:uncharacterized protein LOC125227586 n=1 Tax=Leguminivora glycinivorella TaxID=1035111 RepID=UPI0020100EEC|nr:uncharacterized protein LOC125227586 [Leguminivora glycinivorella]